LGHGIHLGADFLRGLETCLPFFRQSAQDDLVDAGVNRRFSDGSTKRPIGNSPVSIS
jgi:hypothetical protein